jgi:hypothetical protein
MAARVEEHLREFIASGQPGQRLPANEKLAPLIRPPASVREAAAVAPAVKYKLVRDGLIDQLGGVFRIPVVLPEGSLPGEDGLLAPRQVAAAASVTVETVRKWGDTGRLTVVTRTASGHRRFRERQVRELVAERAAQKSRASNGLASPGTADP